MRSDNFTLLVSDKSDPERDQVCDVWEESYGTVLRLGRFWEPPKVNPDTVRIYGAETFALVLAQLLKIDLVSPSDDLIFEVPEHFLNREISKVSLNLIDKLRYPIFAKSVIPKQFEAKIYEEKESLMAACSGLEPNSELLISEIVELEAEARYFICENKIATSSVYEGSLDLNEGASFVTSLIDAMNLPQTIVIDIGLLSNGAYCAVEFNASWGSGLNGCSPSGVARCIKNAVYC